MVLLGLVALAGCGGGGSASTAPNSLSLGAVTAFFGNHDGSSPVSVPSPAGRFVDEANLPYKITLIQVTCTLASAPGFPNTCADCGPSASLMELTVGRFAPSAAPWAHQFMVSDIEGPSVRVASATRPSGRGGDGSVVGGSPFRPPGLPANHRTLLTRVPQTRPRISCAGGRGPPSWPELYRSGSRFAGGWALVPDER